MDEPRVAIVSCGSFREDLEALQAEGIMEGMEVFYTEGRRAGEDTGVLGLDGHPPGRQGHHAGPLQGDAARWPGAPCEGLKRRSRRERARQARRAGSTGRYCRPERRER